jgi:hypothetical protein
MKIRKILDWFEKNNCEVQMFENRGNFIFDIWSNTFQQWILRDANEFQLKQFYRKVKK